MPEDHSQHRKATYEDWARLAEATLKGASLSGLEKITEDGIPVQALYTSQHSPQRDGAAITVPREWIIAQRIEPQAGEKELNAALLEELSGGAQRIEFPSDTDISLLPGALQNVLIEAVSFAMEPGPEIDRAMTAILSAFKEAGASPEKMHACFGADPLAMVACGIQSRKEAGQALGSALDWMAGTGAGMAHIRPFAVAGDLYHQLGLTAAGELAVVLAGCVAILRQAEDKGIDPEVVFRRMEFRLAGEADMYLSLAKIRALRHGLNQVVAASGVSDPVLAERIHGVTSARHLTTLDTDTNILRNTTAMLGMVLGGAGIVTCLPHDWLTGSSARGRRLARNSHHMMRDEARLGQVTDPVAGAYYLDRLTLELGRKAWEHFQEIEQAGGLAESLSSGQIKGWADEASLRRRKSVNSGASPLLGVTLHAVQGRSSGQVLKSSSGPRGGHNRPAQVWEDFRARIEGLNMRVLLLDFGQATGAAGTSRWFQAAGINATAMKIRAEDLRETLAAASPDLIVTDGADASVLAQLSAMPASPFQLEATAFKGDVLALLEQTLGSIR